MRYFRLKTRASLKYFVSDSRSSDSLNGIYFIHYPTKTRKSKSSFQGNMKGTSSISFGTGKCDRTFILNSTGSAFGEKKQHYLWQVQIQALKQLYSHVVGSSFPKNNNHGSLVKPGTKLANENFGSSNSKTSSDRFYNSQKM